MNFDPPLIESRLIRRYKRFLADVRLANGAELTVHCPNTGKMTGCAEPGSPVWLLDSGNPGRKYRYTWELVETSPNELACIHSARANKLMAEALAENRLAELAGYSNCESEVVIPDTRSRIDFCLSDGLRYCYVEVKCVTLCGDNGTGYFPDTVSDRASKHLAELMALSEAGNRSVLTFVVQHSAINEVRPAVHIDADYAALCQRAKKVGVEFLAYKAVIKLDEIVLGDPLPVVIAS
jgi:sugar fermentation stimulation protein A